MTLWPAGAATATGSMPGTEPAEALRLVLGELPQLPYLPELPERGAGADMLGRTAGLLVALPVEIAPSGWRLTGHAGREVRHARDMLEHDLDTLQEFAGTWTGALKLQVVGPWTLGAGIELPSGHRVVSDHGAMRDLIGSLVEGVRLHVADVARRVPQASLVVQVDEPSVASVVAGTVPTPSGYGTVRSVDGAVVRAGLAELLDVLPEGGRVVHSCAVDPPIAMFRAAGADAVAVDLAQVHSLDSLGEAVDGGTGLWLGVVAGVDGPVDLASARDPVLTLWRELGFPIEQLAGAVVPTTACGLAGASPRYVRRALSALREAGRSLSEQ